MTTATEIKVDWLASTVLDAIQSARPDLSSWVGDKKSELDGASRYEVLKWTVRELDDSNLRFAASALDVDINDLQAVKRVLQKI